MATARNHDLTVRRVRFEYPDDFDAAWVRNQPEFSFAANSVSLIMPFAEPYFISAVRAVLGDLSGDLAARTSDFLAQEAAHHRAHRRFNDLLLAQYPSLARPEDRMRRAYGWLQRTRSTRFNLAFAAGSETIAYALARWTEKQLGHLFDGADPVPATLYLWHLAEEVEHKSAAFDVFEALDGSRLRYAWAMTVSALLLLFFVVTTTLTQLRASGRIGKPVGYLRLARLGVSLTFELFPTLLVSALPRHHPNRFSDPVYLSAFLTRYDPATDSMPVWDPGRAA